MCINLKFIIIISTVFVLGIFSMNFALAEDGLLPKIDITLLDGNEIDLDKGSAFIRANIEIANYDPRDGYHFMKVTKLSSGEIIKNTEILPKQITDDLWTVQILHYIDTTLPDENLLGDYELEIYSEFGLISAGTSFSIIKSSLPQISTNATGVFEIEAQSEEPLAVMNEPVEETSELIQEESQIPDWIRNIFVWYAEGTITETDLLSALEYLISNGIIDVEN